MATCSGLCGEGLAPPPEQHDAFIYGAGDWKLGYILTGLRTPHNRVVSAGRTSRQKFLKKLPAMGRLVKAIKNILEGKKDANGAVLKQGRNYLIGLDGRRVFVRGAHAALNTLLQSAGALLMKRALVLLDEDLVKCGCEYEFLLNIHDEWQIETSSPEEVGTLAARAIRLSGEFYDFKCPLKGNYEKGKTWADTH